MKGTCVAVIALGLLAPSTAMAHHIRPTKSQALHSSIRKGERTFVRDNKRPWRHALTNCRISAKSTTWHCKVNVSGGGVLCDYRINVAKRDVDGKVVTRITSVGCIA